MTVDNQLPSGGSVFDDPTAGPIWAALAEKAYAQVNESGWLTSSIKGSNSYAAIESGRESVALPAITGNAATYGETDIGSDWAAGKSLTLSTAANLNRSYLVPAHGYAVVGYDATLKRYTLFNPWGVDGGYFGTSFKPGLVYESQTVINSDFTGATRSSSTPGEGAPVASPTADREVAILVPIELQAVTKPAAVAGRVTPVVRVGLVHPGHLGSRDVLTSWSRS